MDDLIEMFGKGHDLAIPGQPYPVLREDTPGVAAGITGGAASPMGMPKHFDPLENWREHARDDFNLQGEYEDVSPEEAMVYRARGIEPPQPNGVFGARARSVLAGAATNAAYWPGAGIPQISGEAAVGAHQAPTGQGFDGAMGNLGAIENFMGHTFAPADMVHSVALDNHKRVKANKRKYGNWRMVEEAVRGTRKGAEWLAKQTPEMQEAIVRDKDAILDYLGVEQAKVGQGIQGVVSGLSPRGVVRLAATGAGGAAGAGIAGSQYDDPADMKTGGQLGTLVGALSSGGARKLWDMAKKDKGVVIPYGSEVGDAFADNLDSLAKLPGLGFLTPNKQAVGALAYSMGEMNQGQRQALIGAADNVSRVVTDVVKPAPVRIAGDTSSTGRTGMRAARRELHDLHGLHKAESEAAFNTIRPEWEEMTFDVKLFEEEVRAAVKDKHSGVVPRVMEEFLAGLRGDKDLSLSDVDIDASMTKRQEVAERAATKARKKYLQEADYDKMEGFAKKAIEADADRAATIARNKVLAGGDAAADRINSLVNARSHLQSLKGLTGKDRDIRKLITDKTDEWLKEAMGEDLFGRYKAARDSWKDYHDIYSEGGVVNDLLNMKDLGFAKVRAKLIPSRDAHGAVVDNFGKLARAFGRGDIGTGATKAADFLAGQMTEREAVSLFSDLSAAALTPGLEGSRVLMDTLGKRAVNGFLGVAEKAGIGMVDGIVDLSKMKPEQISRLRAAAVKKKGDPALVDKVLQAAFMRANMRDYVRLANGGNPADIDELNYALSDGLRRMLGSTQEAALRFDALFPAKGGGMPPRRKYETMLMMLDGARFLKKEAQSAGTFGKGRTRENIEESFKIFLAGARPLYFPISPFAAGTQVAARIAKALSESNRHSDIVNAMVRRGIEGDKRAVGWIKDIGAAIKAGKVGDAADKVGGGEAGRIIRRAIMAAAMEDEEVRREVAEGDKIEDDGTSK